MENKLRNILEKVDVEEISRNIKWMVDNTPYRIADSDDERRAAQWIADNMTSYGLDAEVLRFNTYNSFPTSSRFELISPEHKVLKSLPCGHIRSTSPEGETMELIYVGSGGYDDYEGIDATGKAVLVEVSYAPATPEKARIAYEKGAKAMVCMNWGSGQDVICHRALKAVWGNPTEETFGNIPQLIGVGITQADGRMLTAMCKSGEKVMVNIAAEAPAKWSQVSMPRCVLHGNGKSDEFILVGSHVDAWSPGVTCNATGNATTLQIAKLLAKHKDELDRDVWFVFWNGHEIAEAAGSTWLVDNYWDQLNKNCVAYFNIDSTGMGEAVLYEIKTADEYRNFAIENAKSILSEELRIQKLTKIGDQSFMGIGIPGTAQRMSYTKEYMAKNCGATLGWWNHTCEDGYDKYSPENIVKDTKVLTSLIYKVSTGEKLPYEFSEKLAEFKAKLAAIKDEYGEFIELDDVECNIEKLIALNAEIEAAKDGFNGEKAKLYNKYAIRLARQVTNVFMTYTDKYQQDSYGYSKLSKPIPLFADLSRLKALDKNSIEYGMVETQLVKNRNRIDDAITTAIEFAELYKALLLG